MASANHYDAHGRSNQAALAPHRRRRPAFALIPLARSVGGLFDGFGGEPVAAGVDDADVDEVADFQ